MIFKKTEKQSKKETREERFKRVASRRVQEILHKMRLLRNCADKANYSYTDEQINKIFRVIEEEWKSVVHEFKKHRNKKKEFRL